MADDDSHYVSRGTMGSSTQDSTAEVQVEKRQKKRVLVVGAVGAGKSSLINMLADDTVAPVDDTADGCTRDVHRIPVEHKNVEYEFIDTPGLDGVVQQAASSLDAIPKTLLFLVSEKLDFNCVLLVWRKGRINQTFNQNASLLKNRLVQQSVPFILVVTGCEMDDNLQLTRETTMREFQECPFDGVICGTTLSNGLNRSYISEIRKTTTTELWRCIEECCQKSFSNTTNTLNGTASEDQNPFWWRFILSLYGYVVKGYETGKSYAESIGFAVVTSVLGSRGLEVTDVPPHEEQQ